MSLLTVGIEPTERLFVGAYTNATHGVDMNVDGAYSGTPEKIHNGTDDVLWTGSVITGASNRFDFASTAQAKTGTKSVDATNSIDGNEAQFERSSAIDSTNYAGFTCWIYITNWSAGHNVEFRFRLAGVDVGTTVCLDCCLDPQIHNVWQKFTIPFSKFGITSGNIDQLVVKTIDSGSGTPDYYLDDLQLEEAGGPVKFRLSPPANSIIRYNEFVFGAAVTNNSRLADASHQNFTWNEWFGSPALELGVTNEAMQSGNLIVTGPSKTIMDVLTVPGARPDSGGDGTTTWFTSKVMLPAPLILDARNGDYEEFVINDDLSGMLYFRALVYGTVVDLTTKEDL